MNGAPIYVSKRTAKSLWQEYRVFQDRIELQSWFPFHTLVISAGGIVKIEVRPSMFRGQKGFIWGVKIDNCDFCRHVLLTKKSGLFKRIGFSPDDPEKFVAVCQPILTGTA